jgi:hypothetical protein
MSFRLKNPRAPMDCARCAKPLPLLRHYKQYICAQCAIDRNTPKNGFDAHKMVELAVRLGYLKPVSECLCVQCGAQATDYDHRDYNKPLEVEPLCRGCNVTRPPAILRSAA